METEITGKIKIKMQIPVAGANRICMTSDHIKGKRDRM
jgi:hypothetical protein